MDLRIRPRCDIQVHRQLNPAEVLGQRPGAVAQFRHVTAGIKQVLAESPQRPLTGIFGSAQREEPQYPSKILQHLLSDISVDTGHYQLVVDTDGPRSVLQGGR